MKTDDGECGGMYLVGLLSKGGEGESNLYKVTCMDCNQTYTSRAMDRKLVLMSCEPNEELKGVFNEDE